MTPPMPAATGGGLVCLGETLALFTTPTIGRLRHASSLTVGFGGAESNVAIGACRLGVAAAWVGKVGADELGTLIVNGIRGEGVDVTGVVETTAAPTSLMIKERWAHDKTRALYYRHGGAGSRLCEDDLDHDQITAAAALHVTGITPALSQSAHDTVIAAIEIARAAGTLTSIDVNYRSALWHADQAAPVLRDLVSRCDVAFAGGDEATLLGLGGEAAQLARQLQALGPSQAVIKLGSRGAIAAVGDQVHEVDALPVTVTDPVGAGDAFDAGYLAELLAGNPPDERLETAAACGALAVTVVGDWEALPTRQDLTFFRQGAGTVQR